MEQVFAIDGPGFGASAAFIAVPLVVLALVWILIARSAFIQGDDMDRPNRVAQLYGYAVCLIAVVVFLVNANSLVESAFTLANPLRGGGDRFGMQPVVSSFEAYRATVSRENRFNAPPGAGPAAATPLPDSLLRARYEALRADRIDQARFDAERSLTTSVLLLALSVVLFALHWRWLRRSAAPVPAQGDRPPAT